jgi:hypothetical protein
MRTSIPPFRNKTASGAGSTGEKTRHPHFVKDMDDSSPERKLSLAERDAGNRHSEFHADASEYDGIVDDGESLLVEHLVSLLYALFCPKCQKKGSKGRTQLDAT